MMTGWLAGFGAGLTLGVRGLFGKELRSRSRGWRPVLLLTGYLGALTLAVAGVLALLRQQGGIIRPTVGTELFSFLALGFVLLLAFITPALTAGAISGERERRTLDLLLVTQASSLGLITGKLLGSVFYILYLLVASLPAFALVYLYGGVPVQFLLMTLAVAAVTAVGHAALGLLLSAVFKRTAVASVVAYVLVIVLVLGVPLVSAISRQMLGRSGSAGVPPPYVYTSPVVSLASVMPASAPGLGLPIFDELLRVILRSPSVSAMRGEGGLQPSLTRATYVIPPATPWTQGVQPPEPETVTVWAPWVYHFGLTGTFTLASLVLAATALSPLKPWRTWLARRRQRPGRAVPAAPAG